MKEEDDKFVFETSMQRALNRETMSKETLNAETYYNKWALEDMDDEQLQDVGEILFTKLDITKFAEAYADYKFKAKVNAITDEEILKKSENIMFQFNKEDVTEYDKYRFKQGAKWFKNRLLNG